MILFLMSCVSLDFIAFNGVPCSSVDAETCDHGPWDSICLACDESYEWDKSFPWFDTMLEPGASVRGIDPSSVVAVPFDSADGLARLDAYYIPSHGENPTTSGITVFYNHGNYGGIEHYVPRLQVLHELGYGIYVWDYRGFGKSTPTTAPTPTQHIEDARTAWVQAVQHAPDPERIVSYGYSLGAISAVEAALDHSSCALVLEAPFTSMRAIAEAGSTIALPESYLSEGLFDNQRKVRNYQGPLLAMVGGEDGRFGPDGVSEIVANAGGPAELWILDGVEHGISDGGIVEAGMAPYGARMEQFYTEVARGCL